MTTQPLTQALVSATANRLISESNKQPSNREVLREIGSGSLTTITKFMRNWRSEAAALGAAIRPLPEKLLRELEQLQRHNEKAVRDELAAELENAYDTEQQLIQENEQMLAQVVTLQAQLETARQESTAAHAQVAQLQAGAATFKRELESERETANKLRIELAKASLRIDESIPQLKQELKECRSQLDLARKIQVDAELKAAVAHERAAGLTQRMSELKR
ncbi:Uncharacterised protein [uncultured Comamonas sp.]|nr:Uncharacterised protein [uncultured Comamonas sp.]